MFSRHSLNAVLIAGTLALSACTGTAPGTTSADGLVLQAGSTFDELYLRPGTTLSDFSSYGLANCEVSFRKNWMRDQNQQRPDISNRVRQENVDEITNSLSQQCEKYLRAALAEEPARTVTDDYAGQENVLVLRPKIVDLDIHAPDTDGPGIVRSYTTSFGEMTLVLELANAQTGEVLARAIDKRRGHDRTFLQRTNDLTNKFETDRILRRWSKQVRDSLDSGMANS